MNSKLAKRLKPAHISDSVFYKKRTMQDFIKKTLNSAAACLKAATWPTRHCSQTANLPRPVFQFAWWSKFDTTVN
jgi:SET domain-containing protein